MTRKKFVFAAIVFYGITLNCAGTSRQVHETTYEPVDYEEHFPTDHTMIVRGDGVASHLPQGEKAVTYAKVDAKYDAERRAREICYGVSIRPCGERRKPDPEVVESIKANLRPLRDNCMWDQQAKATGCKVYFEFQHRNIRKICDSARSEDGMKILAAGCGAW